MLLIGLTFAWGSMWPFLKLTLSEIPLLSFRAGSAVVAGLVLLCVSAVMGMRLRPAQGETAKVLICAAVSVSLWFYLSALGVSLLPAGKAALLAYTMPLWAFLIGVVFFAERVTLKRVLGVAAGLAAILVLAWEDLLQAGNSGLPLGIVAILGAAIAWSTGSTLQKRFGFRTPMSVVIGWQFVLGSVPLMLLAIILEPQTTWIADLSWPVVAAALSVTVISQAFGLWCWATILKLTDVAFASIAVLSVPMVSQILSFVFLGEVFGAAEAAGLALITFGLATILPLGGLFRRRSGR